MKPADFLLDTWKLHGLKSCYFFLCTKNVTTGKWKNHAIKWPVKKSKLTSFFKQYKDKENHVYFCPLPFSKNKRQKDYVIGSKLLWADLDEAHPRQIDLVPQISWQTSPKRYSALWILNKFEKTKKIEEVNRELTYSCGADKSGWDLTQVLRIPGLRNCKYKSKPLARLMWFTDNKYDISKVPQQTAGENLDSNLVWEKYRKKVKPSIRKLIFQDRVQVGKRSEVIWKINNELHEAGLNENEIFIILKSSKWNKFAGRRDEDEQLRREINKISYDKPEEVNGSRINLEPSGGVLRMSDVKTEITKWIWYPYIPKNKITLIEGDPGIGKTFMALAIVAALSNKQRLPEQKDKPVHHKILLMCGEDGAGDTIRPRLDFLKANCKNIYILDKPMRFDEDGLHEFLNLLEELKPTIVFIDPLSSYTYSSDSNSSSEVRGFMQGLMEVMKIVNTTIVGIRHFGKSRKDKSLYQGLGSIEYAASARSIIQVGKDPEDDNGRAMIQVKSNLAKQGGAIGFQFFGDDKTPFIWTGASSLTIDEIMGAKSEDTGKTLDGDLEQFVTDMLSNVSLPSRVVKMRCESKGYSYELVKATMKKMGATYEKVEGKYHWSLSD